MFRAAQIQGSTPYIARNRKT